MSGLDDLIKGGDRVVASGISSAVWPEAAEVEEPDWATSSAASPTSAASAAAGESGGMGGLLGSLLPMLGGLLAGGGLQKVLAGFQANGLTAQANSWVGTGENEPISGADVRKVVGEEDLANIATALGVSEDEAANAVARVLPEVVDRVSPDGHLAPAGELDSTFEALEDLGGGTGASG